jgi:hypothetical protein
MTSPLDPNTAERLARICGMFGSDHAGERASAAAMADTMIRKLGLTWQDVISSSTSLSNTTPSYRFDRDDFLSVEELFHYALLAEDEGLLNAWETRFLIGIYSCRNLTERQIAKLRGIVAKTRRTA